MRPKFPLGRVVATPGALEALAACNQAAAEILMRHQAADWGDVCEEDKRLNDQALLDGGRVLSSYTLTSGEVVWVITESDRSSSCILRPSEY